MAEYFMENDRFLKASKKSKTKSQKYEFRYQPRPATACGKNSKQEES
jgi:hypothetical protein